MRACIRSDSPDIIFSLTVSPACFIISLVVVKLVCFFFFCLCSPHMRLRGQAWHPLHGKKQNKKKNRLWHRTGEFPFLFIFLQICGSSRCCGLSGQCVRLAVTHSPFPVSGCCHVSLLVRSQTHTTRRKKKKKPRAASSLRTSRFYSSSPSFFFFFFIITATLFSFCFYTFAVVHKEKK